MPELNDTKAILWINAYDTSPFVRLANRTNCYCYDSNSSQLEISSIHHQAVG